MIFWGKICPTANKTLDILGRFRRQFQPDYVATWGLARQCGEFLQFSSVVRDSAQLLRGYELRAQWSSDEAAKGSSRQG